jgi:PilZ domain
MTETNNRISNRARVLKGAKIISFNHMLVLDCTVRDLSVTGAKLMCADPLSVANTFRLMLPAENSIQDARVVWRREGMLGIEFTSEKTKAPMRKA